MARLGLAAILGVLSVSQARCEGAVDPSYCVSPDDCGADVAGESFEETFQVRLLQVNTELGRTSEMAPVASVSSGPTESRRSLASRLVDQAEHRFFPFSISILLPHALSFLVAHYLIRRHRGKKAEYMAELSEDDNMPMALPEILSRIRPMLLIHVISIFAFGAAGPSVEYLYLNSFANHYANGAPVDCAMHMEDLPCTRAVADVMQLQVAKGFALPVVQFFSGPALGAISDAFGRRPAVIVIRLGLLIPTMAGAAVVCFGCSIWVEFWLSFFGMIPFTPIPLAWYMDRLDHTPSIVVATSLAESICIVASILGGLLGNVISMKEAILVGMIGKAICLVIAVFGLPESLPPDRRSNFHWSNLLPTAAFSVLFQSPLVEKLTAISVIDSFHYNGFYTLSVQFVQEYMAWSRSNSYVNNLVQQGSDVLWLSLGVNMLWQPLGQIGIIASSTIACIVSNIWVMLSSHPWQVNINAFAMGGLGNMSNCVIAGITGKAASPEKQGMLQSALNLVTQLAAALGPAAFLTVYNMCDPTAPGAPRWRMALYITYGVLFSVPSLMLTFSLRRFIGEGIKGDSDSASFD